MLKVVVQDDGTLSRQDQEYLSLKIRNIRIIPRREVLVTTLFGGGVRWTPLPGQGERVFK